MNLKYQLTPDDYLQYQLYNSSRSEIQNKRRFRSRVVFPILYSLLGLIFALVKANVSYFIPLLIIALIWYVVYPIYSKWKYRRHFQKHIKANYQNKVNQDLETKINNNSLFLIDHLSESRINRSQLKGLIETQYHFFVKLASDSAVIIPKRAIKNQPEFIKLLTKLGTEYVDEKAWEWK